MNPNFHSFKKKITNPFSFWLFMLTSLPSALFAGLRIVSLTEQQAIISVKYKWFNKNPFRSIYVAVLSMAAEVSTGILCMSAIYKRNPAISMLVIKNEGHFYKKATSKILFTCADGKAINDIVEDAVRTGESTTINCHTTGTNEKGETVAEFYFTWSLKVKRRQT